MLVSHLFAKTKTNKKIYIVVQCAHGNPVTGFGHDHRKGSGTPNTLYMIQFIS